jgi:hypothetical protein
LQFELTTKTGPTAGPAFIFKVLFKLSSGIKKRKRTAINTCNHMFRVKMQSTDFKCMSLVTLHDVERFNGNRRQIFKVTQNLKITHARTHPGKWPPRAVFNDQNMQPAPRASPAGSLLAPKTWQLVGLRANV